jgi:hypothetical protein
VTHACVVWVARLTLTWGRLIQAHSPLIGPSLHHPSSSPLTADYTPSPCRFSRALRGWCNVDWAIQFMPSNLRIPYAYSQLGLSTLGVCLKDFVYDQARPIETPLRHSRHHTRCFCTPGTLASLGYVHHRSIDPNPCRVSKHPTDAPGPESSGCKGPTGMVRATGRHRPPHPCQHLLHWSGQPQCLPP